MADREGKLDRLWRKFKETQLYQSIYMNDYPTTNRTRVLAVLNNLFLHLHPARIKRFAVSVQYTWCLGGLSFFLFLFLAVTGVVLMFYYVPSVDMAYQSMLDLESSVAFGQLFRNLHRWAAHAMVIAVLLHMTRVFLTGSYKPPRQFNWVIGTSLFGLTLFMSFTGYLLPWDQLSYWAITVGTNMATYAPFVGDQLKFLLLGGYEIGQNTLIRWYALHVLGVPTIAFVLMLLHFWRIRKDGGISGPL